MLTSRTQQAYDAARERYAEGGVDADAALARLSAVPISLHCWQGDDVGGFEQFGTGLDGRNRRDRQLPWEGAHAGGAPRRTRPRRCR